MNGQASIQTKMFPLLVCLGAIFGSAFLFMKVLVDEIGPTEVVAGRMVLGAATVLAVMAIKRVGLNLDPSMVAKVSLLALMDTIIPYTLVTYAETGIDSGVAAVLISTMPLFTTTFAALALPDEKLAPGRLAGIALGFAGVVTLAGSDVLNVTSSSTIGQLGVIGAAASYGVAAVYAKTLLRTESALSLTGLKLSLGAVMAVPIALAVEGSPAYGALSVEGWASLVALGVLATGLAFTVYFWIVAKAGSVYGSLVTYIVPVSGLLLGWAVLGESIGPNTIGGMALIALGVGGVMYSPSLGRAWAAVAGLRHVPIPERPLVLAEEEAA